MPGLCGQESPAEELTCFGAEFGEVATPDVEAHDGRALLHHALDPHAMSRRTQHWLDEAVSGDEREGRGVEQAPPDLREPMAGEVRTGQLVRERQPHREVGAEVQRVPGLVAEALPC